jgi:Flp pilus assembly pilin Flp
MTSIFAIFHTKLILRRDGCGTAVQCCVARLKMPGRDRMRGVIAMRAWLSRLRCSSGATAIEYAMVAALISVAAFVAIGSIGGTVSGFFQKIASNL